MAKSLQEQYNLIMSILDSNCNIKTEVAYYQMIMGSGKSSYIAPLLSLLIMAGGKYPIHVMPEVLVNQSIENMNILSIFGVKNIYKKVNRVVNLDEVYAFDEIQSNNTT